MRIEPVTSGQYDALLPLIADYQRFYEVEQIDEDRNREFFARFIAPSEEGMLLGAFDDDGSFAGYACLYWHRSSLAAADEVLMNDLFVVPERRGSGVGRALIEASAEIARERGAHALTWATAPGNERAQRLYDSFDGVVRETWLEYELSVKPDEAP
jgi:GNAT superfamily N-acetyltransferase